MPDLLQNRFTWPELCEHTISKIHKGFKNEKEAIKFRNWFMERECLGWVFDYFMVYKAFKIWCELKNDYDHFTVITGREGEGKSTLAMQLASWVVPSFDRNNLLEDIETYREKLRKRAVQIIEMKKENKKPELLGVIFDEGIELLSKEHYKKDHVDLLKTLIVQRRLHAFVIICVPNFFFLETSIRQHRVRSLFHIYRRGRYKYFSEKAVKIVADSAAKHKDVMKVKLPLEYFETGAYSMKVPKTIVWDKYDDDKLGNILKNLTDAKKSK